MVDLAEHAGLGPVQSHDIAERQGIPEPYLNQLLALLRKADLIASRRGPGGGHMLARPADEITLGDLVAALEGPVWSAGEGAAGPTRVERLAGLQEVWDEVSRAVEGILGRTTLAGLVERERRGAVSYQI